MTNFELMEIKREQARSQARQKKNDLIQRFTMGTAAVKLVREEAMAREAFVEAKAIRNLRSLAPATRFGI